MVYLQVNALSEWIIGIYLHEFTNTEREISIPQEVAQRPCQSHIMPLMLCCYVVVGRYVGRYVDRYVVKSF